ncbi:uncharacterized protein LOC119448476 [Dermacentor silvarum]|uniref:uncharacterized protein LOC119448476 n=1 Tax=Dermacentor silvarum TaxID=543639 RepID=UPI0021009EF3|nr:uncharacterized protein LOC119448476 [Dermacentor silvarum]
MRCFILTLATTIFVSTSAENLKHLIEALNTTQRSYMKYRSYVMYTEGKPHKCLYTKKENLSTDEYWFLQDFIAGDMGYQHRLHAKLGDDGHDPYMTVDNIPAPPRSPSTTLSIQYRLKHWNSTAKCAVFTLYLGPTLHCEHHKWKDQIKNPQESCDWWYRYLCNDTKYQVYFPDCP